MNNKPVSEKDIFQGQEIVTINVEITKELNDRLVQEHKKELMAGQTSLTFEQLVGGLVQMGYNWTLYQGLKKIFDR